MKIQFVSYNHTYYYDMNDVNNQSYSVVKKNNNNNNN